MSPSDVAAHAAMRGLDFVGLTSHEQFPLEECEAVRKRVRLLGVACFACLEMTVVHRGTFSHVGLIGNEPLPDVPLKLTLDAFRRWKEDHPAHLAAVFHPGISGLGRLQDADVVAEVCAVPEIEGLELANEEMLRWPTDEAWELQLRIYERLLEGGTRPLIFGGSDAHEPTRATVPPLAATALTSMPDETVLGALRTPGAAHPVVWLRPETAAIIERMRARFSHLDRWVEVRGAV